MTEVEVFFDSANTFRPDVAGWRRERMVEIPTEVPILIVPDWICEVLSTNKRNDLVRKKRVYHHLPIRFDRPSWVRMEAESARFGWRWVVAAVGAEGEVALLDPRKAKKGRGMSLDPPATIPSLLAWLERPFGRAQDRPARK